MGSVRLGKPEVVIPPNNTIPPQPKNCQCCEEPFKDGLPEALTRSYSTKPGQPEWAWWWVCAECSLMWLT